MRMDRRLTALALGLLLAATATFMPPPTLLRAQSPTAAPETDPATAETARLEAELDVMGSAGRWREALPLAERLHALLLARRGPDDAGTINFQARVGLCHAYLGDYPAAERWLDAAGAAADRALPATDPAARFTLGALAMFHRLAGRPGAAARDFERLVPLNEAAVGPDHPDTTTAYFGLGIAYMELGQRDRAEEFTRKAIASYERTGRADHADLTLLLSNLGMILAQEGRLDEARVALERALAIADARGMAGHPLLVAAHNNLGETHMLAGRPEEAERCYRRAVAIAEASGSPEQPNALIALNNLALLEQVQGRLAESEEKLRRVVRVNERVLGASHPQTATSLTLLGVALSKRNDWVEATPLLEQAVTAFAGSPDPLAPAQHLALTALSTARAEEKRWARAEQLLKKAYRVCQRGFGPDSPPALTQLTALATLYRRQGLLQQARPLLERVLTTYEKSSPPTPATPGSGREVTLGELTALEALADVEEGLGNLERSGELYARAFGATAAKFGVESPTLNSLRRSLAWNFLDRGKPAETLREARLIERTEDARWAQILSFTAEEQRLRFQEDTNPFNFYGTLGEAEDLARSVLRHKGLVLDSVLEDRRVWASATPGLHAKAERLRTLRQRLAAEPKPADAVLRADAGREAAELEAEIAREVSGLGGTRRALAVEPTEVCAALPAHGVLVELASYRHHLGHNRDEWRYGAVVLARSVPPVWVPLGAASEIDSRIARYRKSVRGKTDEETLTADLRELGRRLWEPVAAHLPAGTGEVIFCPDDELHAVSFATLLVGGGTAGGEQFLAERYAVRYVASGRDLLPRPAAPSSVTLASTSLCVFANPEFTVAGRADAPSAEAPPLTRGSLGRLNFGPLAGTAREAEALRQRATGWGWPPEIFTGPRASEANLRRVRGTHILHLATHGFVLESEKNGGAGIAPNILPDNPMVRSGLALAGAQTTLTAWREGRHPPGEDDGILTAEEVAGLPLENTWLVVLSACDTGAGEARGGEGVLGLRRGFVRAGAQHLLMTLWPVADQETAEWMVDFYTALARPGADPAGALAATQCDWLVRLRREKGLLHAVNRAGAFILSSQGRPE